MVSGSAVAAAAASMVMMVFVSVSWGGSGRYVDTASVRYDDAVSSLHVIMTTAAPGLLRVIVADFFAKQNVSYTQSSHCMLGSLQLQQSPTKIK